MALQRHLVVFARELRLGRGKRRLARRIGTVAAINFQRVALRTLLLRLGRDLRWKTWVALTPDRGRLSGPAHLPRQPGTGPPGGEGRLVEEVGAADTLIWERASGSHERHGHRRAGCC